MHELSTEETVQFSRDEGLAVIRLNRPEKLNSFNAAMHARFLSLLNDISRDDTVRALFLTGEGRGFCAGQDLGERRRSTNQEAVDLGRTIEAGWNPIARALHNLPVPVVCAVNGVAAGAGVSLALGCDVVFAGKSARFVLSFSRIGLVPDAGATYYLPRLIGPARAMAWALNGSAITSEQAADWGLIWACVEDTNLEAEALQMAADFARGATLGLRLLKQTLNASLGNGFDAQLELERRNQRLCGFSSDYREGVAAFLEKRAPRFTGK